MTSGDRDDVDRLRAALAARERGPAGRGPVEAGRIFDAVHGRMAPDERLAIVDDTLEDPEAAEAWRLAADLAPPIAPSAAGGRSDPTPGPVRSSWTWLAMAAALVLAVGAGWQQLNTRRLDTAPTYRGGDARVIQSRLSDVVPRASAVLRWTAIEGARYRVRVFTADLQLLDDAPDLAAAEYALPGAVVDRVPAGASVLWQVEATVSGEAPVVSPTFSTRLD